MSAETMRALCKRHGLTIKYVDHGVEISHDSAQPWQHKRFTVTLARKGAQDYGAPITYRMGIPVMAKPRETIAERQRRERKHKREIKQRVPTVDGVVAALFTDASSYDSSLDFADYCDSFGCSQDSIKARDAYLACGEASKRIRLFLGPLFDDFAQAMKDY